MHKHAYIYIYVQVRRDKELLSKKSELLALEGERLKDAHATLATQLRTAQATAVSLQASAPSGSAGQEHAQRVAFEREFGLMRDSNAMMRQREEAREAELGRLREQLKALEATVEPLRRDKEVKQREAAALAGQLEEQGKENRQWQVRALTAAVLTAAALATAAYFSWLHSSWWHSPWLH